MFSNDCVVLPAILKLIRILSWAENKFVRLLANWHHSKLAIRCTMQKGARLHRECSVLNLQNNPKHIRIGAYSQVRGKLQLFAHGGQIEVGEYCYVGENSYIWSAKRIKIGDRVLIAHGVNIHDNISHPLDALSRHNQSMAIIHANHPSSNLDLDEKPVVIEDDVWIGFNATILRGITIGQGAIVGACSVVTENVPAWSVVVGNPAKVIKTLSPVKVK